MDVMESRGYTDVYDLLNCPIPDYSDCPETAQDYVSARLELEECDELCHGNWIEIESLQRQVDFLKKLLEENSIVLPDDYYDL